MPTPLWAMFLFRLSVPTMYKPQISLSILRLRYKQAIIFYEDDGVAGVQAVNAENQREKL